MYSSSTQYTHPIFGESTSEAESSFTENITSSIESSINTSFSSSENNNLYTSLKNSNSSELFSLQHTDSLNIQSPIVLDDQSMETPIKSAFTPIRKREHSIEESPIYPVRKSLRFDSSTESSPYYSRNTSSILDEYEIIPLHSSEDLVVLDDCPSISTSYEKEFITIKHVGEGNFFVVDIVLCKTNNCPYAIKRTKNPLSKSSERKRYLKEIQLFAEVKECPNLMKYYKSWQDDRNEDSDFLEIGYLYTLMECCSRGNLTQYLNTSEKNEESFIWYVLYSVLQTLVYLHVHDIVHLDIKPENILFTEVGCIRVGDLGCASHINEGCSSTDLRYMAIEGLEDVITPARDIFSLGLVIYQLMSKEELPISGDRWSELRKGEIQSIEAYSANLNNLVKQMTREKERPTAYELLSSIPQEYINSISEIQSMIRTKTTSVLKESKRKKVKHLSINPNSNEVVYDRSDLSTPVDLIKNNYPLKFSF